MKYIIFFLLVVCYSVDLVAQDLKDPSTQAWQALAANQNSVLPNVDRTYIDLKGSPFLFDERTGGSVTLNDGTVYELMMKYDIFQDGLWVRNEKIKQVIVVDPETVEEFEIKDSVNVKRKFVRLSEEDVEKQIEELEKGYYEIIYEGENDIFIKWSKTFLEADYKGAYSANKRYDEFSDDNPRYFVLTQDGTWLKVKSRSSVLDAFPDREDELKTFIKKNKIKFKEPEDFIDVIKYYEGLN